MSGATRGRSMSHASPGVSRTSVRLTLDPSIRAAADRVAGANNISLSMYIEQLIRRDIEGGLPLPMVANRKRA